MNGKDVDRAGQKLHDAITALDRACERALAAIDAIPDPQHALEWAVPLADLVDETARNLASFGAKLRAKPVRRIWLAEELTLSKLASRIGVSKQRAGRILRAGDPPVTPPEEKKT